MLLRNRRSSSRAMNKPNLISDHHHHHNNNSQSSSSPNNDESSSLLLCSLPKLRDFTMKCLSLSSGIEALPSPTSILDTRIVLSPLSRDNSPFSSSYENNKNNPRILFHSSSLDNKTNNNKVMNNSYSKEGIGLALVGTLKDDDPIHHHHHHEKKNNNILFGTQLRVKTNNNNNNKGNSSSWSCGCCSSESSSSSFVMNMNMMSLSEMELSEEYTCVITHNGPNPRKTHIFVDNCIVETFHSSPSSSSSTASSSFNNFLSFCYTCKKHLEHTKDIFIYRGDKAFCSEECRHKEMVLDGAAENS
ncbi:zinc-finger of the FCS-type, C2-C2 [Stylosanthes scabra]|uniref:Zinc-finger of the FCS-type, C2-C2 n=1 Tax=Stylosanthes scabra TaxID=79078 RepID=A0ABU6U9W3_9FABA|nr:zinc-finger of the FCS-type, C2-C2 [Stylosanthes scabra]